MDLKEFLDSVSGPLPKSYCLYFRILTIFTFVCIVLILLDGIALLLLGKSLLSVGKSPITLGLSFGLFVGYLVEYFTCRLLYSMCIKTLD